MNSSSSSSDILVSWATEIVVRVWVRSLSTKVTWVWQNLSKVADFRLVK